MSGAPDTPPSGAATEPPTLRAFVNERAVEIARGGTALDAVRAHDALTGAHEADAVATGARVIVDSRGLPLDPTTPAHGGAIYRTLPARRPADAAGAAPNDAPAGAHDDVRRAATGEDRTPPLDLE